jgi:intraflagellar transport protein 80
MCYIDGQKKKYSVLLSLLSLSVNMLFLLQEIPLRTVQLAEMALLGGNVQDAESMLLQNGLVFRSIVTNLHLHNWNR